MAHFTFFPVHPAPILRSKLQRRDGRHLTHLLSIFRSREHYSLHCAARCVSSGSVTYLYIRMELCQTCNLNHWLDKHRNQRALERCAQILKCLVSAIDHLHSRNYMHRDIKVFLSQESIVNVNTRHSCSDWPLTVNFRNILGKPSFIYCLFSS